MTEMVDMDRCSESEEVHAVVLALWGQPLHPGNPRCDLRVARLVVKRSCPALRGSRCAARRAMRADHSGRFETGLCLIVIS